MTILTKLEDIISIPLEIFHKQKGYQPVDICRMAVRCMIKGVRKGLRSVYVPNCFDVRLHPAEFKELSPFLSTIRSDIKSELMRVAKERGYVLKDSLDIKIVEDSRVEAGCPHVESSFGSGDGPTSSVILGPEDKEKAPTDSQSRKHDDETIVLKPKKASRKPLVGQQETARLTLGTSGASLVFLDGEFYVENPGENTIVSVDDRTASEIRLTNGAEIRIGRMKMIFSKT